MPVPVPVPVGIAIRRLRRRVVASCVLASVALAGSLVGAGTVSGSGPGPAQVGASAAASTSSFSAARRHGAARSAEGTLPERGVASGRYAGRSDEARLRALRIGWTYDWGTGAQLDARAGVEYVPMLWGAGSVTDAAVADLRARRRAGTAKALLGFNEPDLRGQANMTPARAVSLWPRLVSTGLRLGSPAVASPYIPSPTDRSKSWLGDFMDRAHARGLRVDFIALHFYQDFTNPNAVSELRGQLIDVHRRYGRPIWITEIGALDVSGWHGPLHGRPSASAAQRYMQRVTAMLDSLPWVERYAWFMDNCAADAGCRGTSLYDRGDRLTALGRLYRSLGASRG